MSNGKRLKSPIRWGIWGAGAIAHQLAADFPLVRGAILRAVASRTAERAEDFASHYGIARSYAGLEPLLNDRDVDVIYVATPNHCHMADSLACMAAGKAVLCEKPFALNLTPAQQIADAARLHRVFCMEAMWTRFIPAVIEAKRAVHSGAIGPVRLIQGNFAYPVAAENPDRFFNAEQGGGALLDRGVYLISLAQYLFGSALSIHGTACVGPTGVDEQSAYQLTYRGGVLADFAASLRTRGTNEVSISGERGVLRLCEPFYRSHGLTIQSFHPAAAVSGGGSPPKGLGNAVRNSPTVKMLRRRLSPLLLALEARRIKTFPFAGNGYQFELQHVSDALRQGRIESPIMPLGDSLEVMRCMDVLHSQMHQAHVASKESHMRAI